MITLNIVLVLMVVCLALYLFFKEIFPTDVTAIIVMVLLLVLKLVSPHEGISGFSNHAVITILCMFILSAGIEKTGLIHRLSLRVFGITKSNEILQLLLIMTLVAVLSGFLNNAAIVAILLPFVLNLSKMSNTYASKLLIPLSYVSMSAGMLTLIGTSTNLLANDTIARMGLVPFEMFHFWKVGFYVLLITIIYFVVIGYWILPKRKNNLTTSANDDIKYSFEVKITKGSRLIGKKIKDSILRKKYKVRILLLERNKEKWKTQFSNKTLEENDLITVEASKDVLNNLQIEPGIMVLTNGKEDINTETLHMVIPQDSKYINMKLNDFHTEMKDKMMVVAVRQGGKKIIHKLENVKLKLGDLLILKTTPIFSEKLKLDKHLMIYEHSKKAYNTDKRLHAILIMVGVVVGAALNIYPILVTALIGVVLMFMLGVISPKEAYKSIRWDVIFLLAGLIPLGIALEKSGASALIALGLSKFLVKLPILWVLIGFYIFTTILTEILSNNASVILLVPIAVDLSTKLGINPYSMILIIMFAASTSFLTPVGYKTNTMIYGTGIYKFSDFFKTGALLNLILSVATPLLIIHFFGV
jgi:di/tricarboxylate transporter